MTANPTAPRPTRPAGGFSLVEALVAILVVGLMLTAALNSIGAAHGSRYLTTERAVAWRLAGQLADEIMALPYEDPDGSGLTIGRESGETNGQDRSGFDDVDDYNFWTDQPPHDKAGNLLPGLDDWQRFVDVDLVGPTNLDGESASDTGLKRITIIVRRGGKQLARLDTLRSRLTDSLIPQEDQP